MKILKKCIHFICSPFDPFHPNEFVHINLVYHVFASAILSLIALLQAKRTHTVNFRSFQRDRSTRKRYGTNDVPLHSLVFALSS